MGVLGIQCGIMEYNNNKVITIIIIITHILDRPFFHGLLQLDN